MMRHFDAGFVDYVEGADVVGVAGVFVAVLPVVGSGDDDSAVGVVVCAGVPGVGAAVVVVVIAVVAVVVAIQIE